MIVSVLPQTTSKSLLTHQVVNKYLIFRHKIQQRPPLLACRRSIGHFYGAMKPLVDFWPLLPLSAVFQKRQKLRGGRRRGLCCPPRTLYFA